MRRFFIRLLLPILTFILPASIGAQEQRIAAIVNDDVVSTQDLDERLGLVLLTSRIPDQEQARTRLSQQVLRGLIEESLQLQEAERLSIDVAPEEIDRALNDIAGRNEMSIEQLQKLLQSNDINPKTMLNQLRAQISWLKIVNQRLRPQVNVTVDQLEIAVEEASQAQSGPARISSLGNRVAGRQSEPGAAYSRRCGTARANAFGRCELRSPGTTSLRLGNRAARR